MALSITHTTVAVGTDAGNGEIAKTQWNEAHTITGLGTGVETWLQTPSGANLASALTTALPASKGGTGLTALGSGVATWLGTPTSANLLTAVTDALGTGKLIFSAGTLAVASGKTLTVSNTLTFTGTDSSSVAFGAGGTVLYDTAISDTAYDATSWNGVTTVAPSKNAVRDQIEAMVALQASDTAYASSWNGVTTIPPSKNAIYDKVEIIHHPGGTPSGNWIICYPSFYVKPAGGSAVVANTIRYRAFFLRRRTTFSDLGAVITTLGTGNIGLAIYAVTNGAPSGTPLAATGNIVDTGTGFVSGDITGADVTLDMGWYYAAFWASNSTVILAVGHESGTNVIGEGAWLVGNATATNVVAAAGTSGLNGYNSAEAFNTSAWPNATSETLNVDTGEARRDYILLGKVV